MGFPRRQFLRLAAGAAVLPAVSRLAWAQAWPAKLIRTIVPFTPGTATDIIARTVFELLSERLGQSIIVENRSGAGGTIGATLVAKADPDGYTILVNSSSHTIIPSLYPNAPYNTTRDFSGVIPLGSLSNVLVVSPSKGFKSLRELVAAARAKPARSLMPPQELGARPILVPKDCASVRILKACMFPSEGRLRLRPK